MGVLSKVCCFFIRCRVAQPSVFKFAAKQAACFETMLGVMRSAFIPFCRCVLTCLVISCFMFWSSPTWADQNDPELDRLFSALLGADNLVQGSRITEEIWQRWRQVDDTVIGDLLVSGITAMNALMTWGWLSTPSIR